MKRRSRRNRRKKQNIQTSISLNQTKKTKVKVYKPLPYTEQERQRKITNIYLQLMQIQMDHVLTAEIKQGLHEFIKNGTEYHHVMELPAYSRVLKINFVNDKKKDAHNGMHLQFRKISIDNGDPKNPLNQLNKLQEGLVSL